MVVLKNSKNSKFSIKKKSKIQFFFFFFSELDPLGKNAKRPRLDSEATVSLGHSFVRNSSALSTKTLSISTAYMLNGTTRLAPSRSLVQEAPFLPLGTVLEEFVGRRARDGWLKWDETPVIPLPPFANFSWEWGIGDCVQFTTKLM